jgi:hypothetical protein
MSKKGRRMSTDTEKKLEALLAKFEGVEKKIEALENQLKSPAPGIGETAPPDLLAQMFCGPGVMPGVMPGMMPGMMPPAGPFTIWWAWWLSWFLWPFALPLAASGAFPYTSRFAAARAEFFGRWLEAMARMTQQAANVGPFMGFPPTKPIETEVASKLRVAFSHAPLNQLFSQEQRTSILWAVQLWSQFFHRVRPS